MSEPSQWRRLLVPIKDLTAGAMAQFQLAERLAAALGSSITQLHLHDPRLTAAALAELRRVFERWRPETEGVGIGNTLPVCVELHANHGLEPTILHFGVSHDLVILRSQRRLVAGLPIPASDLTNRLVQRLNSTTLGSAIPSTEAAGWLR